MDVNNSAYLFLLSALLNIYFVVKSKTNRILREENDALKNLIETRETQIKDLNHLIENMQAEIKLNKAMADKEISNLKNDMNVLKSQNELFKLAELKSEIELDQIKNFLHQLKVECECEQDEDCDKCEKIDKLLKI